jgi:hypothetical protein
MRYEMDAISRLGPRNLVKDEPEPHIAAAAHKASAIAEKKPVKIDNKSVYYKSSLCPCLSAASFFHALKGSHFRGRKMT